MDDLFYDDDQSTFSILTIDPGTTTLGYSILKVDIITLKIVSAYAWTVDSTRLDFYRDDVIETHGDKFARIIAHKRNLENVLRFYKPLIVVSETPFFNRLRPSAGGPLYELYATLEQTVYEWDKQKPLYKAEPKSVKKAVGASHNADKIQMRDAVKKIDELSSANIDLLDQHAIDALAIGYFKVLQLRNKEKNHGST